MTVKELEAQVDTGTEEEAADAKAKLQWRARFQMLNARIAEMTAAQVKDKAIMRLSNNGRGSPELAARATEVGSFYDPQAFAHSRAISITAALNLHHEMRGSKHRHDIRDEWDAQLLAIRTDKLREEIDRECAST